ncbi:MAG: cytidylate kinase [Lentisphaerae bacterium RIFOXYA12_FULL_48_11]|nr:MAG: cytidylate kinase [Lentisphaerae bacterium RIFOXYA12_FULL_48_11]
MANKVVAIDGPSASGKSTVAKRVAAALGFLYVDSGALYRAVTWKALQEKVSTSDASRVSILLQNLAITFYEKEGIVCFKIDDRELKNEIRAIEVNENVSKIAAMPEVRSQVVVWLRDMVRFGDLVMEGRDIATAVFPNAEHKFYLDASEEERAKRRFQEIHDGAEKITFTDVNESLKRRDAIDKGRKMDPLRMANGAVKIDTTGMNIDQVVQFIVDRLKACVF